MPQKNGIYRFLCLFIGFYRFVGTVTYSRVVKPNEKPFLTIKIKNKGE